MSSPIASRWRAWKLGRRSPRRLVHVQFHDTLTICNCSAIVGRQSMGKPNDLVQGTLDLLILKIVSLEPRHGWAIAKRIQQVSKEALQVQQGSLYPALHRLEEQGWIKADWRETETADRRSSIRSLVLAKSGLNTSLRIGNDCRAPLI
jgi:PadR family transcriptional regulator PadR